MTTETADKIAKLKQYDDGHYWSVDRVAHEGTDYAVISDGANRYVLEYSDIHGVDELLSGGLSYSRWCSSNYTFDSDEDMPRGLKDKIRVDLDLDFSDPICINGSV